MWFGVGTRTGVAVSTSHQLWLMITVQYSGNFWTGAVSKLEPVFKIYFYNPFQTLVQFYEVYLLCSAGMYMRTSASSPYASKLYCTVEIGHKTQNLPCNCQTLQSSFDTLIHSLLQKFFISFCYLCLHYKKVSYMWIIIVKSLWLQYAYTRNLLLGLFVSGIHFHCDTSKLASKMAAPLFETCYVACCANRTPNVLSWGRAGLIAFGTCNSVAVYDPQVITVAN